MTTEPAKTPLPESVASHPTKGPRAKGRRWPLYVAAALSVYAVIFVQQDGAAYITIDTIINLFIQFLIFWILIAVVMAVYDRASR